MDRYFIGPADGGPLPTEKGGGTDGGEKAQTRKALSAADGAGGVAPALVGLGRRLEQSQPAEPVTDSTTTHHHTESKTLRKERRKKIAQGHAVDDHEEKQTWQQTM